MNFKDIKSILLENKRIIVLIVSSCTLLAFLYCYIIATPYYKSQSNFYQKKTSSSLSGMSSSFGRMMEKQLGLGSNDKSFKIHIPELIYDSDIILNKIIQSDFNTSVSEEAKTLSDFWGFNDIKDNEERKFLLKEKLRKLINISVKEESELIMMSIETEDKILSSRIMASIVKEIETFIKKSTSEHYKELKKDINEKLEIKESEYNSALSDLEVHLNNSAVELSRPDMKIKTMKLENEANLKYELYVAQRLAFEKAENLEKDNTETLLVIQSATQPIKQSWPKNLLTIVLSFISSLFGTVYLLVLKRKFG